MGRPVLEFVSMRRPPFELAAPEIIIGRSTPSTVLIEGEGVGDRHAKLFMDASGKVLVQDLDSFSGTMRNGNFVYGRQELADGDELKLGSVVLRFHADGAKMPTAGAEPATRTLMGVGPPPELTAALNVGRTVEMAPVVEESGVVVGTPDPEPTNNRTMQMDSSHIEALLAAERGAAQARPTQPAQPQFDDPATVMTPPPKFDDAPTLGSAAPKATPANKERSREAFAPTMPPPSVEEFAKMKAQLAQQAKQAPLAAPMPSAGNQGATMMMEAPVIPPPAPPSRAAPPPAHAPAPAPLVAPTPSGNQGATMMMEAPAMPPPAPPSRAAVPTSAPADPIVGPRPPGAAPVVPFGNQQPTSLMDAPQVAVPAPPPRAARPTPAQGATLMSDAPVLPATLPRPPQAAPQPTAPPVLFAGGPAATPQQPGYAQPQGYAQPATAQSAVVGLDAAPYTPPAKGSFGSFSRAFAFMGQMFALAGRDKTIIKPVLWDLIITTPVSIGLAILMNFVHSAGAAYALLAGGTAFLYFTDYLCNSFTASLMYDLATTGKADMGTARKRVGKAIGGILTFAAVSALLDVASTYARERDDIVARIVLRILRAIWTTATYIVMPALVIEGVSFGAAFGRSKKLMDHDPTGVGAGVVAMSLTSYAVAIICFALAGAGLRFGARIHPILGGVLYFTFINLYWSVAGWLKIAYATCFYLWARECERVGHADNALAPRPLRTALDAG